MSIPSSPEKKPIDEILNWQLDKTVDPYVLSIGQAGKDSGGVYRYLRVSSSGALSNDDAANFRVSALGVNIADISNSDAADFRMSAFAGDAGQFRVSSIGGSSSPLSADSSSVSAKQGDAANLRVSAIIDSGSVSAKSGDAGSFRVSALDEFSYYYLSATGIQTIKSAAGTLHSVIVNTRGTASSLKIYDNTSAASGLQIAKIDTTFGTESFVYDVKFPNGLTVSTADAGAADLTITYR